VFYRGYGFQRLAKAFGGIGAAIGFAALYALLQALWSGSTDRVIVVDAFAFSILLATAYLRTRALWLGWGLNFAWKATRALVFGLAVNGVNSKSPVVQGDPMGPFWLTGGGFGLDSSWLAVVVLLAAIPLVFRVTRELDFRYNAPVIVPAGIPVDLDAAARRQHEAAMGPSEPAPSTLVQIQPLTESAALVSATEPPPLPGREFEPEPASHKAGNESAPE
jgi:hypothetical protein